MFTEASIFDVAATANRGDGLAPRRIERKAISRAFGGTGFRAILVLALAAILLSGCSTTAPKPTPSPAPRAAGHPPLLRYALSLQGVPYRWGGTSPVRGFDCSGYVQYVYRRYGVALPRTARAMAGYLPRVSKTSRRPGDLIFFQTTRQPYSHVGIYLGRDDFVHASKGRGKGVQISNLRAPYWRRHWQAVGRPPVPRGARSVYAEAETLED